MYGLIKDVALRVMKAPTKPPEPPAGSHDAVQIYRASPRYLTYRLLVFWLIFTAGWLLLWGLLLIGLAEREKVLVIFAFIAIPILAVVQFFVYFEVRIDYDMRYYIVTDRSLRIREGAFIVKEKTISYANVQNLHVVQGPLLRYFGIWNLRVDTAGGGGAERGGPGSHSVQVAGIENAHAVRDLIRGHLQSRALSAGLGDLDDGDEDAPRAPALGPEVLEALEQLKRATTALRVSAESRS